MKTRKILSILIIIPISVLAVWGFLHFENKNSKPLIYENNKGENIEETVKNSRDVKILESENIPETVVEKNNVTPTIQSEERVVENKPKEISDENLKVEEPKKTEKNSLIIKDLLVSWGFSASEERSIDTIVLHSSYNIMGGDKYDVDKIIQEYKEYGVSPHYVIDRTGNMLRLVKDSNVAYHAGESETPDGRTGVNNFSIGIELINNMEDKFTSNQYDAVNDLISYLKNNYKIKYILGHNQIAPGRKTDPWNINWEKINR